MNSNKKKIELTPKLREQARQIALKQLRKAQLRQAQLKGLPSPKRLGEE